MVLDALAACRLEMLSAHDPRFEQCLRIRMDAYTATDAHAGRFWAARDAYDDDALHFLATRDGHAIAAARMLMDTERFEIEQDRPLTTYREIGPCAEVSRLAVVPAARRGVVLIALFRAFYHEWVRHGIRFIFCGVTAGCATARMYGSMGFTRIPGSHHKQGCDADYGIMVLDLDEAVNIWRSTRPEMLDYFLQPTVG
ncbi:MAG: hypothetical protein RBU27_12070 [Bacteroidota bacterium]|jgi:GNAT superfamily N-acetyltransferase|nr:hypothetical protein [Bacteroidota bacterium]